MSALTKDGAPHQTAFAKASILAYGIFSYLVFFACFLYAVGFIGKLGTPTAIDGPANMAWPAALGINSALLALFALQHSVMARPFFKRWLTRYIPQAAERSTYVLMSSIALAAVFAWWEPLGGEIWHVESTVGRTALYAGFGLGWLVVLYSTFLINHFDLFGLRQVWLEFRGQAYSELKFVMPWMYRIIRHPLYFGWLMVLWLTPDMTITHLVFAGLTTAYVFIGMHLEERDLKNAHPDYRDYQQQVPMIIPGLKGMKK
ncbi:MAG: methanethiol S-methyltransferase [Pseudomonadota bacterium]